jgi:hypothetical protein
VRGGALRRGNQGGALRLKLDVFKVGGGAVGGGWIQRLSARRGEAEALSCDGGGNRAGRRRSMRACWAGRGRREPRKEWVGAAGWANSIGKKKKNQKSFEF